MLCFLSHVRNDFLVVCNHFLSRRMSISIFDRALKIKQRSRSAALVYNAKEGEEDFEYLRNEVASRLVDRLKDVRRSFTNVLDIGSHRGAIAKEWFRSSPESFNKLKQVVMTEDCDLLAKDLDHARFNQLSFLSDCSKVIHVTKDEILPLDTLRDSFDLVVSSMALHWVNDLPGMLIQARQCLKPDGLFLGAFLGGDTLIELRHAFAIAEQERDGGVAPHISPMAGVRDGGDLLNRAGFTLPAVDSDTIRITFPNAFVLMHHLRGMGESNAVISRRPWTGRDSMLATAAIYDNLYRDEDGVSATFQIIYLTGWSPDKSQPLAKARGSAQVSLADLAAELGSDIQTTKD